MLGFPPKVVPLEAVFIVILWKCSKNLRDQAAVVVGLWVAWASRSLRRVVHAIHSRPSHSLLPLSSYSFNVRQRWHVAEGRVAPFGIVVAHPPIHNRDQLGAFAADRKAQGAKLWVSAFSSPRYGGKSLGGLGCMNLRTIFGPQLRSGCTLCAQRVGQGREEADS